ncbi:6-hydroxymethylpterin diphosphokinase MptE-like protein [[Eubacterium] cellulosolvens]
MDFSAWEPIYTRILADFAFDRKKDEEAAMILKGLLSQRVVLPISELAKTIENKRLFIFGSGPSIEKDIESSEFNGVKIAADGATSALLKHNIFPDIIVTDLDGYVPDQVRANQNGAKIVIHAHGDNIPALRRWVPKFENKFTGSTQARPDEKNNIHNFGGFTDGDRAVFLGAHFNARHITLVGFSFDEVGRFSYKYDSKLKLRKLTWANLLIGMIKEPPVVFLPGAHK